ncbi:valine--pyruvate transaminase [Gordonia hirsuta DSM 44140 = NBRC 16056]|uniref:Aminotransferase n=1 Tax=Gordonia hirsuta DSM 44140 = NBRC 16056 TaxID=1121927 RepID=L7LCI7_9ACTN|nr:aminotransferase class I/II-fold pyridoxal phosphate-dependent enzyme [Gordonia hirsuta]GAC58446.1 valine--pyruvate transaminase [Gordonia hirsuta DSM 44140 = NBRC 16056]
MEFSRRAHAVTPFYAMEYGRRAAELEAAGTHVVKLNIGEPDFGAPPAFLSEIRRISDGRPMPYTSALGTPQLREAIAGFSTDRLGAPIDPRRVIVTTGASAALLLACAALIDPGDEVLVADPSYPCNRRFAESFGAQVRLLPTGPNRRFQLDAQTAAAAWTDRTRGVMTASPANPTGTSLPYEQLLALSSAVADRGGWRIIDEIYLGLADDAPDGSPPKSIAADDPGAIVVNSFSKYFGMTGWRLGWMVIPEQMIPVAEKLAQNYYICPPTPAQVAALTCFTPETIAVAQERRAVLRRRRELVLDGLAQIPSLRVPVAPDGAFYIYLDVSGTGMSATEFCDQALARAHVAMTPGKDFGDADAERYVRLSYATGEQELQTGLERLGQFLA